MPRSARLNHPNTWHHVMNRGADRQDVFLHDADYRKFEWLLGHTTATRGVEVHAYCLMTNHFHLLLHCHDGGLSEAMQAMQFRYAQWFNHRYDRDGPVFRGRFRSVLIESDEQLVTVGRYIHRNPLDLVPRNELASYPWSSLPTYLGHRRRRQWLITDELLGPVRHDVDRFREFVEIDLPSDSRVHDQTPRVGPSCDDVDAAVCSLTGIGQADLRQGARGVNSVARAIAISLCVELRTAPAAELADRYGLSSRSSVRTIARRGRIRIAADPEFAELHRLTVEWVRHRDQRETFGA